VVLFGSIPLSHSKAIHAKVVSFFNLYTNALSKQIYNFDAWWIAKKHEAPVKESFDIQAGGPPKARDPGHLPGLSSGLSRPASSTKATGSSL